MGHYFAWIPSALERSLYPVGWVPLSHAVRMLSTGVLVHSGYQSGGNVAQLAVAAL
jgi:hypothetical protein